MEKKLDHMTERILDLTLEIIYLLTGEDYGPIKKVSDHRKPPSMIFKESGKQILEVNQKIIDLLTGEVPIRCQDVTVYFSMEEWEYIEGHKDLYKDVMMEKRPPLTSPDGSSNGNPPERCPHPLYSWDSTQEHQEIPQKDQEENLSVSRIESEEEGTSFRDDERSDKEKMPSARKDGCSTTLCSGDLEDDYKILQDYHGETLMNINVVVKEEEDLHVMGDEPHKEQENPPEISTDGSSDGNPPERCPRPLYSRDSTQEHQEIPQEDQEENLNKCRIEGGEDAYMRDDEQSEEEENSPATQDRCTSPFYSGDLQDYQVENVMGIKVKIKEEEEEELYGSGDEPCKHEDIPTEISTGGPQSRNYENRRYIFTPYGNTLEDFIEDSSGRSSMSLYLRPGPGMADLSLDKGNFPGHSLPITHRAGGELFPFSEHRERFIKEEELITDPSSHSLTETYSHSNYENSFIQNCFLQRHQSNHAWGHPYSCTECGKGFKLKSAFIRHKRTHTEERPFSCTECGKSFSQRAHLVSHERIHTGVKPYCCSECGKCFSHKISLITHESFHTGVKPFFCTECGKQFSRKSVLILHERVHTGEKPYPCPECGKCFSQRTHLNTHRRSHTSERPYSCSECGKTYSRKSYLVDHLRTHTGVKPYSCSVCGKCFSCKSNLITHQTIHSSKKPFSCAQCGKSFQTRSAFTYHKKLHAADKLPLC